jgi:hypothetical protein
MVSNGQMENYWNNAQDLGTLQEYFPLGLFYVRQKHLTCFYPREEVVNGAN